MSTHREQNSKISGTARTPMTVPGFKLRKEKNKPISMVTSYDYWSACAVEAAGIDCILVGDSAAMVVHGFDSTIPATLEMMEMHVAAVRRGAPNTFVIADMPFLTSLGSFDTVIGYVRRLMQAGANAVKIEGAGRTVETISRLVDSGVPVMGHIGLTPQSVHTIGGYKVQGKNEQESSRLMKESRELEEAGCFSIVLECVPSSVGTQLSSGLAIPVIGIGAGNGTDGQVLVLHDLLGLNNKRVPKFVRKYLDGFSLVKGALEAFHDDVAGRAFPLEQESYT